MPSVTDLTVVPCGALIPKNCKTLSSRSEEHTSELQSRRDLVCRLLLEKKKHVVAHGADQRTVIATGGGRHARASRIARDIGICVHFEDPRLSLLSDSHVDAAMTVSADE